MRICSHNCYWFQGADFTDNIPALPKDNILAELVGIYKNSNADIICLQEIQNYQTFSILCDFLCCTGEYVSGNKHPQYGGAILWSESLLVQKTSQNKCVDRFALSIELNDPKITICNVHLSSNRYTCGDTDSIRVKEIQSIENDAPDIILGDLNETSFAHVNNYLTNKYNDVAIMVNNHDATNIAGSRGDYCWIKKDCRLEVTNYQVLETKALSDHKPIVVSFKDASQQGE